MSPFFKGKQKMLVTEATPTGKVEIWYLGMLLNCPEEIPYAVEHLGNYEWSIGGCQKAFNVFKQFSGTSTKVDFGILFTKKDEELTPSLIAEFLSPEIPVSINPRYYRRELIRRHTTNLINRATIRMNNKLKNGDTNVSQELREIEKANATEESTLYNLQQASDQTMEYLEDVLSGKIPPGFKTDWEEFNQKTGGIHPRDLVVIAGRPSMGKTAFGLNILNQAIMKEKKCVFFSLEMDNIKVMLRLISNNTKIDSKQFLTGNLNDDELDRIVEVQRRWHKLPENFYISDAMGSIEKIKSQLETARAKMGGVDFVMIDYLQLITTNTKNPNREREVAYISSELKNLCREYGCTVFAISQLSRNVDSRNPPVPFMSDLRDSGSIEQDADMVLLLYRPGYYKKDEDQEITKIIIAKNRNGEVGQTDLRFLMKYMYFKE